MPHHRVRFLEELIAKDLKHSPCIALMGMRQVGKSTLIKKICAQYYTFDDTSFSMRFDQGGQSLLSTKPFPIAFDEVQKHPPTFDALKLAIDNNKIPGRYIISGSVRFSSKKNIRESLTGRMVTVNLLPFTLAESHGKTLSPFTHLATTKTNQAIIQNLTQREWVNESTIQKYLMTGGLPGICFSRELAVRNRHFEAHLDTLLGRDIHLIRATNISSQKLLSILRFIASKEGQKIVVAELAKQVGTTAPTLKSTLMALEGLFLIRPYGQGYFIEDPGLAFYLFPLRHESITRDLMIKSVFHELRAQLNYTYANTSYLAPFETRGGAHVPFVVHQSSGLKLGISIDETESPSEKSLKSLNRFLKTNKNSKAIALCRRKTPTTFSNNLLCLPWHFIF